MSSIAFLLTTILLSLLGNIFIERLNKVYKLTNFQCYIIGFLLGGLTLITAQFVN